MGARRVRRNRREYLEQARELPSGGDFPIRGSYPIYGEWNEPAGQASGHYFHQDLLVARSIHAKHPQRHIDVGSSIYGFVSHVASFREIDVIDIRPGPTNIPGITFLQADIMNLPEEFFGIADSISCLHALEHFGLGRYGDPVDMSGWRKGLVALASLAQPEATVYLSVPTGKDQRVEFNAHRVFALPFLRNALEELFDIESLAFVDDAGDLHEDIDPFGARAERSFEAGYGCSIWTLRKSTP